MTLARAAGLRSISVGETSGVAGFYRQLGFTRTRGWSRHSLLVMT